MIDHEQQLARALAIRRSQIKPDVFSALVNRIADIRAQDNATFDSWEFIEIAHGRRAHREED